MKHPFLDQLKQGPLLADGAMGTMLYSRVPGTLSTHRCFDELNITHSRMVQGIHSEYIAAGARVIETNSFGANRIKLSQYGLGDQVRKINHLAANIAREAREISGLPVYVAGAIGPSGLHLGPAHEDADAELRDLFCEQADALIERGVDLIILETFANLAELRQALLAIRSRTDLPIVAQMSFAEDAHTLAGQSPAHVALALADLGADVVGANCSVGPAVTLEVIEEMATALQHEHPQVFLSAMPNAGLPTRIDNRFLYVSTPEYFAEYARRFTAAGVRLIGGCCGTTPRHIAAMAATLGSTGSPATVSPPGTSPILASTAVSIPAIVISQPPEEERILPPRGTPTPLQQKLQAGHFVLSAELDPPKGLNPTKILDGAARLKQAGVDCINIADSPMARVRMSCLALARLIHDHFDLDTIIHFTTRDRNLMALQSELLGAHALGIRNILALTGDPLRAAEYPGATGVWDVDSIGLIRILKGMNEGHDAAGASIGRAASFFIGAALNLSMDEVAIDLPQEQSRRKLDAIDIDTDGLQLSEIDLELARYHRKLEAGADFIMTQPIYDIAPLERFLARVGRPPVPLILGIIPLYSAKHAEYLHHEVPGITIPQQVRDRMRAAGEHGSEVGLAMAHELILEAAQRKLIQGAYIMPSYGRYDIIEELIRAIRRELQSPATSYQR